ncbi:hypothetical protein [Mesorhizobium sp. CAU 1732]|uniref:DUF883 family protein n=1 Tax=Mesorhizobium sp. CAU 1732 TaxID=3140358 RepID=UPI00325FE31C
MSLNVPPRSTVPLANRQWGTSQETARCEAATPKEFEMATSAAGKAVKSGAARSPEDLEAEIDRLRDDVAKLTEQLTRTGEHSVSAAKRAASEGAEQLRVRGEAAVGVIKQNADDLEQQLTETVREKPITSLAIAAGVGFFLALLSRR